MCKSAIIVLLLMTSQMLLASEASISNSTSITTSKQSVEKTVKKNWKFRVSAGLLGRNYFNESDSISLLSINPRVNYSVPKTKLDLSGGIYLARNESYDDKTSYDIDMVTLAAYYPFWKNENGTSISMFSLLEGYQFSTKEAAWKNGVNRFYMSLGATQKLGNFSLKMSPTFAYYITNPNYKHGDMDFRLGFNPGISYKISKAFSAYHKQEYKRYFQAKSYNLYLTYFGMKYYYKKFGLDTSLSFADKNIQKLWNLNDKARTAWLNIVASYTL
jgi:hypothetical protein